VEVTEKNDEGYVVRWTFGKTEVISGAAMDNPLVAAIANITENLSLDLKTDPFGSVIGLKNKDEVKAKTQIVMEQIFQYVEDLTPSKEAAAQIRSAIEPLMANLVTDHQLEASMLNDPQLFYLTSGGTYQLGMPLTYDDLLPNPLGGAPFPSEGYFLLEDIDSDNNKAKIEWGQTLDPEKTTAVMRETMAALAQSMGRPAPSDQDIPLMHVDDLSQYQIDTETGWPISLSYERNTTFGPQSNVERLIIQVIPE